MRDDLWHQGGMTGPRIKFCGMTRTADALLAADLGVNAIGLVLTRRSPRFVELDTACAIASTLPPFVDVVALFMDDDATWVREVECTLRPDWLQFHGREDDAFCAAFATPHIKAIAMGSTDDLPTHFAAHPHARAFLLDGHAAGNQGGCGQSFDWSRVPAGAHRPIILAGGLDADNVAAAIAQARPWAVDVSSGIESSPGIKDPDRMRAFINAMARVPA